jgi:hypothetical protein
MSNHVTRFTKPLTFTKPILSTPFFRAYYTPQYVNFFPASQILGNPYHPLHFKVHHQVATAPHEGLRWYVQPNLLVAGKKCIRVRCERRVKVAVMEALKEGGWNKNGFAVQEDRAELRGTLEVSATKDVLTAPWEELRSASRDLVAAVASRVVMRNKRKG